MGRTAVGPAVPNRGDVAANGPCLQSSASWACPALCE